ncbi:MAG: hypothetical protein M3N28_05100 [Actinomycetota bacterium]|nr:hypothetical protein [Actinomycetota bacterium]
MQSDTAATLSAAASAAGTVTATLGPATGEAYGFIGWSPESDAESESYTIPGGAGANSPSTLSAPNVAREQRWRG